ncbi:MAG: hypothetical protein PHS32_03455 [Rhodoferax sp.]|uniref:hypothetical protein n=1 Tax=Rhodoferax sp. TaxID=50421 RepID=UPI00262669BE|nr:hypothetical protein [Rhodoferax sp.]MDD5332779.1 hypothetical protein [Rhodoferax sp.]
MFKLRAIFALPLGLLLGLSGCGGGSSTPAVTPVIQGAYQGTSSNGKTLNALVLEDGSFWNIYGISSGSAISVQGVATGSSSASNGAFTISFKDFYAPGISPVTGTGSGAYSGSNLIGTLNENGVTASLNLTTPVSTNYNYNTAADIASITGGWSGGLLDGETATVNIQAAGTVTGSSSLGCSFTGTIAARPSGKNVFNISLTFGAAPCALPNQTASGVALTYPVGDGKNQLVGGLVTPSQTAAIAFFAVR